MDADDAYQGLAPTPPVTAGARGRERPKAAWTGKATTHLRFSFSSRRNAPAAAHRLRPGRAAGALARRAAAALALVGGLAAPAAWGAEAAIVSTPGADMTYAPGVTPDVIQVEVTFDAAVSVTGNPVFDLRVGTRVRPMSFQGGSGTTTLSFTYTVQSGDLDKDGVSHSANAVRGGRITYLADGSAADRTVQVLARADDHKVDGVAPRFASVQVTSTPEGAGTYKAGEAVVVSVRFDETVQSSTPSSLELDFDGSPRDAARTGIADDTLTFSYTVVAADFDADGIRVPVNRLEVTDSFGNAATRATVVSSTRQKVDAVVPGVSRATITSSAGGDQTYQAGDHIDIRVVFNEPVRGADGSSFALLVGAADAASARRADYRAGDGTDRVDYRYEVSVGDMDSDGISFAAGALSGSITDRAGNALPANAVPALAEQAAHKVDGGVDNESPRVSGVAVTSQPTRHAAYAIGRSIEVTVRFNETVVVTDPALLKLVVSIGSEDVRADFDETTSGSSRLRFRYTIAAGDLDADGIAVGPIAETLVGGAIADPSGNTAVREFQRLADQSAHRVDGVAPEATRVEIVSDPMAGNTYGLGEEIEVEVGFSEAVVAHHDPDLKLVLTIGTQSRQAFLASDDRTSTLTFRYRVQQDDFDGDGVAIGATAFVTGRLDDLAGNQAAAAQPALVLADQAGHRVDARATTPATVAIVSDAGADNTYARGDVIELDVTFDEPVVVTGSPELVLTLGASTATNPLLPRASLARQRPQRLTFQYVVQDGDRDEDGISVGANALVGGDIVDSHGNPARRLTPVPDDTEHQVDGVEPVPVSTARVTSTPASSDDTYGLGETIAFAVSFSEVVHVTESGSDLVLRISVGEHSRNAVFTTGSGTRTLHFRYVVTEDDRDDDGVSMGADAMVCWPNAAGCSVADSAGNALATVLQGMPAQRRHRVDGRRDEGRLSITSRPARGGTYGVGEDIVVALAFPHAVFVLSSAGALPELALSLGGSEAAAAFDGGSGTSALRFRYTVQAGDFDGDGISVAAGPGALLGGRIEDAEGDVVPRDFGALPANSGHRVDAVRASAVDIEIVSVPVGEDYGLGETIEVEVAFDEVVHVTEDGSELELVLAVGEHSRRAMFVDGSGTDILLFAYRVDADDRDDDGISIGPDALVGGVIEDIAGNETEEAGRRLRPLPAQPGHKVNPDLDRIAPTVVRVAVASMPVDATYRVNETITVEVEFDETVHVSGAPTLALSIGADTHRAGFGSGSGTQTLAFSYVVRAGDFDDDGISVGPGTNSLTGGTIQDGAANEAVRAFEGLPADRGHTVNTQVTMAEIVDVRIVSSPKTYRQGDAIDVDIEFGEVVHVTGGPVLTLSIGARDRSAPYATGSGTDTLRFSYAVEAGDFDDDGISIGANALAGGTVADAVGTPVRLDFAAIPQQPDHRVDAVLATVAEVSIISEPGQGDAYEAGESIEVAIVFDEDVLVTGEPVVALSVGAATRYASFTGGAGTTTLTFAYVVESGDQDSDGISVAANSLAGGTITDLAGNEAVRDFRGLPADPGHRVAGSDVESPTVTELVIDPPDQGDTYLFGEPIEIRVGFSEEVHVTGAPSVALSVGAWTRSAAFASGSGTRTLVFRYEVQAGDVDEDGLSIGSRALMGGVIEDAAGNAAERGFDAVLADPGRKVDGLVPVVGSVAIASDPGDEGIYAPGDVIEVAVEFDGVVLVTGAPVLSLGVGANTREAAYSDGSGTSRLAFRYVVRDDDYDGDGISIPANALVGGALEDESGNPADRSYSALGAQAGHRVIADVVTPTVAAVDIAQPAEGDTYLLGETIEIRIAFSEAVHVTGRPSVVLSVGPETRSAAYASGSGTDTLVFRYEVQRGDLDDDGVSIGPNALNGGGIEDGAGNAADRGFHAVPPDAGRKVDGLVPAVESVAVVSAPEADETYQPGEEIRVEVSFDGEVRVEGAPALTLNVGDEARAAAYASGTGTAVLEFRYVVREDDYDQDGIGIAGDALTGGVIEDESGNPAGRGFEALGPLAQHKVVADVVAPAVVQVEILPPEDGNTYLLSEAIEVRVRFSETVHVTGQPSVGLSVGAANRSATLASGSGTDTLAFRYEVLPGDYDEDGVSIPAGTLTGGTIEDAAGNAAEREFDVPADRGHPVDGVVPAVESVAVVSAPEADETYQPGEEIRVEVTFDDDVLVEDAPVLTLTVGDQARAAEYASGTGTTSLEFRYVVREDDYDEDGIGIAGDALTGGVIEDANGNPAGRGFDALGPLAGHKVVADVVAPTVSSVDILPPDEGDTYLLGEAIEIRVAFSETVHVTGQPSVGLSVGAATRSATLASGSGTDTLAFRYEVRPGDYDEDGVSIPAGTLTGGTIEDAAGNAAERQFDVPADRGHPVDGVVPTVDSVAVVSAPAADETYRPGEEIRVEVTFDDDVRVEGVPVLTLTVGDQARAAAYASGTGTGVLEFRYVVREDDYDEDGIGIAGDALTGGVIEDASGNPASRGFAAIGPLAGHKVVADVVAPTVEQVKILAPADGDTYLLGETIEIQVRFSEAVHVTGQPSVGLSVGAATRLATLASGSGTDTLAFRYEVLPGDYDEDGVSIPAGTLTGGTIEDAAGNAAERDFDVPADQGHPVDGVVPAVDSVAVVSAPEADETYQPGEEIRVEVAFDGAVQVEDAPVLTLTVGAEARAAAYRSGTRTARLEFRYVVREDDYDEDGIAIAGDALTGGVIEDASGNPAGRGFAAIGPLAGHKVVADVVAPTVERVKILPPEDGETYLLGDRIEIRVEFSEAVHVTGQPTLALSVGAETRLAALVSGSGSPTLAFRYAVQAGDRDDDGLSIGPGALAGGRIADAAGNAANRELELRADESFPVDGAVPSIDVVYISSDPGPDGIYTPGDVIVATVGFNEAVHVAGGPALVLGIGANDRSATYADGSGTRELHFRYTVVDGDYDQDGIGVGAGALTGGTIEDASGNPVDRAIEPRRFPGHRVWPEIDLLLPPLALEVGRNETVNLTVALEAAGVVYGGGFTAASDAPEVATARTAGAQLIVTPVSEGTAAITATARRAPVTVVVPVVVEASPAETAVLQHALAAVGRGLLSGAADTVGGRLENFAQAPVRPGGGRPGSPFGASSARASVAPGSPFRNGHPPHSRGATGAVSAAAADPFANRGLSGAGLGPAHAHGPSAGGWPGPDGFSIALRGLANPTLGLGIWGGGDVQTFEGDPDEGAYDGRLTTVHLGIDAIGNGWIAGASVSRSQADVSYDFDADASGAGDLEVDLTAVYPYVQWSPGDSAAFWVVLGFGSGEAEARRAGGPAPDEPGELSMSLGLAGLRLALGGFGGLDFALRGDGGMARLETEPGLYAIQGVAAGVQRFRAGLETSWPVATGDGTLTPFVDVGGRWDGGDGTTGGGLEVLGGIRYRGSRGGLEIKGRTLALHGAEGYSESGVAASLFLAPKADGRGLTLALTPRRGSVAAAADPRRGIGPAPARDRTDDAWSFDGRIGYGFGLRARPGIVAPFAEAATGPRGARLRLGVGYEWGASSARWLRAEASAARHGPEAAGSESGFRLTVEARF